MGDQTLDQRFTEVRQRADDALARSGRAGSPLYLVAVTKYAEPDDIRHLIELGHRDFGESRVQQLVQRASVIQEWFHRMKMLPETVTRSERLGVSRTQLVKLLRAEPAAFAWLNQQRDRRGRPPLK